MKYWQGAPREGVNPSLPKVIIIKKRLSIKEDI
jgi:hypothetical protein